MTIKDEIREALERARENAMITDWKRDARIFEKALSTINRAIIIDPDELPDIGDGITDRGSFRASDAHYDGVFGAAQLIASQLKESK